MRIRYDKRAIRRLRMERGLAITELARRTRISKQALSLIDRGYGEPKVATLARVASALDVDIKAFFSEVA